MSQTSKGVALYFCVECAQCQDHSTLPHPCLEGHSQGLPHHNPDSHTQTAVADPDFRIQSTWLK